MNTYFDIWKPEWTVLHWKSVKSYINSFGSRKHCILRCLRWCWCLHITVCNLRAVILNVLAFTVKMKSHTIGAKLHRITSSFLSYRPIKSHIVCLKVTKNTRDCVCYPYQTIWFAHNQCLRFIAKILTKLLILYFTAQII